MKQLGLIVDQKRNWKTVLVTARNEMKRKLIDLEVKAIQAINRISPEYQGIHFSKI
jgi:hypothetical protein